MTQTGDAGRSRRVNQFYGGSHTLWDVDLDVPAGGCVCLMGRNGVGKTTLLKVIMGLLPARPARIKFRRTRTSPGQPPKRARARASATCPRAARSSRSSPSRRT